MSKTYRLLKDYMYVNGVVAPAGTMYKEFGSTLILPEAALPRCQNRNGYSLSVSCLKETSWFEEVEGPEIHGPTTESMGRYNFYATNGKSFQVSRKRLYELLEGDDCSGWAKSGHEYTSGERFVYPEIEKMAEYNYSLLTASDREAEMKKVFEAARIAGTSALSPYYQYPTFQDYLNSIK